MTLGAADAETANAPLRVLHLTSVETSNYHLNSLADELHPNSIVMLAATLGGHGGFVDALLRGVSRLTRSGRQDDFYYPGWR